MLVARCGGMPLGAPHRGDHIDILGNPLSNPSHLRRLQFESSSEQNNQAQRTRWFLVIMAIRWHQQNTTLLFTQAHAFKTGLRELSKKKHSLCECWIAQPEELVTVCVLAIRVQMHQMRKCVACIVPARLLANTIRIMLFRLFEQA